MFKEGEVARYEMAIFYGLPSDVERQVNAWFAKWHEARDPRFRVVSVTQSTNPATPGFNSDIYLTIMYEC